MDSLTDKALKRLRTGKGGLSDAELVKVFADIRAFPNDALLAKPQAKPAAMKAAKGKDPLVTEVETIFKPAIGRASDKANLLVEVLAGPARREMRLNTRSLGTVIPGLLEVYEPGEVVSAAHQAMKLAFERGTVEASAA
jgi:hypothetical protein